VEFGVAQVSLVSTWQAGDTSGFAAVVTVFSTFLPTAQTKPNMTEPSCEAQLQGHAPGGPPTHLGDEYGPLGGRLILSHPGCAPVVQAPLLMSMGKMELYHETVI